VGELLTVSAERGRKFDGKSHVNVVCSMRPSQYKYKGKKDCRRRQTLFFCPAFLGEPATCIIPCFEIYHMARDYKMVCKC
jgi:hypothetical protein